MKKFFAMLCLAVLFAATGEARAAVIDFTGGGGVDGDTPGSWQLDYDSLVPGVDVQFNSPYFRWFDDYNNFQAVAIGATNSPLIIDFVGSVKLCNGQWWCVCEQSDFARWKFFLHTDQQLWFIPHSDQ